MQMSHRTLIADIGITRDQSSRYQQLAAMPDQLLQTVDPGKRTSSAKRTKPARDFQRLRDDDRPADSWCSDCGEFVAGPEPPRRARHLHQ